MKRGQELSIGTVGVIVLTLIVVVVVALLVRQVITGGGRQLTNMSEESKYAPDKCTNIFLGRGCYDRCEDGLKSVPGYWKDCIDQGRVCCEHT